MGKKLVFIILWNRCNSMDKCSEYINSVDYANYFVVSIEAAVSGWDMRLNIELKYTIK